MDLPEQGIIQSGQYSNQITVLWTHTGDDSLMVSYYDVFLGCGGHSSLLVHIRGYYSISGDTLLCQGDTSTYRAISDSASSIPRSLLLDSHCAGRLSDISRSRHEHISNIFGGGHVPDQSKSSKPGSYCDTPQYFFVTVRGTPPAVVDTSFSWSDSHMPWIRVYRYCSYRYR